MCSVPEDEFTKCSYIRSHQSLRLGHRVTNESPGASSQGGDLPKVSWPGNQLQASESAVPLGCLLPKT